MNRNNIYYRQCILKKGDTSQIAWIPEMYASLGNYVKLKEDDGWQIIEVGSRLAAPDMNEQSQDYKHQRKASDI